MRLGQSIVNDMLKNIRIDVKWCEPKGGFVTSVSCSKLFNMTDKEFSKRYLSD